MTYRRLQPISSSASSNSGLMAVLLGQQSEIDMDAVGEAFLQGAEAGVANDIAQVSPTGKGSLSDSKNVVWSLKKAGEVAALQQ